MTSHLHSRVRDHTTRFWRCVGMAFTHFLLGSHNVTVTATWLVCEVTLINDTTTTSAPTLESLWIGQQVDNPKEPNHQNFTKTTLNYIFRSVQKTRLVGPVFKINCHVFGLGYRTRHTMLPGLRPHLGVRHFSCYICNKETCGLDDHLGSHPNMRHQMANKKNQVPTPPVGPQQKY